MLHIIITAYREPDSTIKSIESFLNQKIKGKYKIIVTDPFPEIKELIKKKFKNKNVEFFLDPGEGKGLALNILFEKIYSKNQDDIIILTDGDVYVSENSVSEILESFKDKKVGCVTGRPVSLNSRNNKFGYWSNLLFDGGHKAKNKLSKKGKFLECSGYLMAIRNGVLQGFPLEAAEDSIIPYLFWKKEYKIKYLPKAEVYVKNPEIWSQWEIQKRQNIRSHETQKKIAKDMPRTKSFFNEIKQGTLFALLYPKTLKEIFWTALLFFSRFYVYMRAFYELKFKKKTHKDGWRAEREEIED